MLVQATDPNTKKLFLIRYSEMTKDLVEKLFNPILFQIRELTFLKDEEEFLLNNPPTNNSEIDNLLTECVSHRISKVVEINWNGKTITQ